MSTHLWEGLHAAGVARQVRRRRYALQKLPELIFRVRPAQQASVLSQVAQLPGAATSGPVACRGHLGNCVALYIRLSSTLSMLVELRERSISPTSTSPGDVSFHAVFSSHSREFIRTPGVCRFVQRQGGRWAGFGFTWRGLADSARR